MTNLQEYFAHPALSQSKLKELKRSPRHLWSKFIDPLRVEEDTPDKILGRAAHCYLFEREKFENLYCIAPVINRKTNIGKAIYNEFQEANAGKIPLKGDDYITIQRMVANIHSKKSSKVVLQEGGKAEYELYWIDEDTGLSCKAKLDYFIEPHINPLYPNGVIVDYKSIGDASYETCRRAIDNYGYYNQGGFYCKGVKQIYKTQDYPVFICIFSEKSSPYDCQFFCIDDGSIDAGMQENQLLMLEYKECLLKDRWEGYKDEIQMISLPHYAFTRINNKLGTI